MKRSSLSTRRPSIVLSSVLVSVQLFARVPQETPPPNASIGERVADYIFREFQSGSDGRQKLSEFLGQPVLVVNWTDTDFGRGAANEVEKLAKELAPKGLVVILLDTHNRTGPEIEASVMRLYPGSRAWLAQNQKLPIEYEDNGPPPDIALVGVDGTLLVAGSYTSDMGKAAKLARSELKRLKSGWGEHDAARKARALAFGAEQLAAAKLSIEAALAEEPDQRECLAVRTEIAARWDSRVRSVTWLLEHGEPLRALDEVRALTQTAKGDSAWEAQAAALLQGSETAEMRRELELDRELGSILAPLAKKAPDREGDKLRAFAKEAGETRVGRRALHLAEIAALAAKK